MKAYFFFVRLVICRQKEEKRHQTICLSLRGSLKGYLTRPCQLQTTATLVYDKLSCGLSIHSIGRDLSPAQHHELPPLTLMPIIALCRMMNRFYSTTFISIRPWLWDWARPKTVLTSIRTSPRRSSLNLLFFPMPVIILSVLYHLFFIRKMAQTW